MRDATCPNYIVCHKMYDSRLKVCTSCFWRFKNEILEFKTLECTNCHTEAECVKFRKCEHFVCLSCFDKLQKCPNC